MEWRLGVAAAAGQPVIFAAKLIASLMVWVPTLNMSVTPVQPGSGYADVSEIVVSRRPDRVFVAGIRKPIYSARGPSSDLRLNFLMANWLRKLPRLLECSHNMVDPAALIADVQGRGLGCW